MRESLKNPISWLVVRYKISEAEHPLHTTLTNIHDILVTNSITPDYHKTDIWCRGLIAVSLDNQNCTIWKHSFRCKKLVKKPFKLLSLDWHTVQWKMFNNFTVYNELILVLKKYNLKSNIIFLSKIYIILSIFKIYLVEIKSAKVVFCQNNLWFSADL